MFIHITPKRLDTYEVDATFEHQGIRYNAKYRKEGHFINALKKTKDKFIDAVVVTNSKQAVLRQKDIKQYLS